MRNPEYDAYLYSHINNVIHGYEWILSHISQYKISTIFPNLLYSKLDDNVHNHDKSKYSDAEYSAYNNYFYGLDKKSQKVLDEFNLAWSHHIHHNPHHWQYWCLITDDGSKTKNYQPIGLDMPDHYIIEMICDWWAFSWKTHFDSNSDDPVDGLYEIFDWYNAHRDAIIFSENTRKKVNSFLKLLKETIDAQKC